MKYTKENWPWGTDPFWPHEVLRHLLAVIVVMQFFIAAVVFIPGHPEDPANPASTPPHLKPEWYFLPVYQILKIVPRSVFGALAEPLGLLIPMAFALMVLLLPFLDRNPERRILKRKVFFALGLVVILAVIALGIWGSMS
ncbi:MAG: hypothetical protein RDV48_28950 [Candidatus Eremiobacteraeota bacterium]|nr:hypothetical protein [Candidatus Eremiobacteraeota bacterium]